MENTEDAILSILRKSPGQHARELAASLGTDKTEINGLLYGRLREKVTQDRDYRWRLVVPMAQRQSSRDEGGKSANTDLAKLCNYYLACLSFDEVGVSCFASSKFGDADYVELPFVPKGSGDLADGEQTRALFGRIGFGNIQCSIGRQVGLLRLRWRGVG